MGKIGYDNQKYIETQSAHIRERIGQFGGKLYLEFGGKLFDDYHASRVLPGFAPDSKVRMLQQLRDDVEIVIAICAGDIEKNKVRGDLGIPYEEDVLRLIDEFRGMDLYVGSVVVTQYSGQSAANAFLKRLEALGVRSFRHYPIDGYPHNVDLIVSEEGYGRNDYIETSRPLVVVTAPGPGSGKMAACLSQLYHENKRGRLAGYAKFETFPVWNLPIDHPVNLAYEAATADLSDVNMIDPFHLAAYGETTVNYNRDVEVFPILRTIGLLNNLLGLALVYVSGISMGCFIFQKFFQTIPMAMEESARMDGAGDFKIFFRIIVPLCKPVIMTVALITAIGQWNDFYMPMVLLGKRSTYTLTLIIYQYIGQFTKHMGESMAAVIITLIPIIVLYFLFSSQIVEGISGGAVKG